MVKRAPTIAAKAAAKPEAKDASQRVELDVVVPATVAEPSEKPAKIAAPPARTLAEPVEKPVDSPAKVAAAAFEILTCDVSERGFVTVSFSALAKDAPDFYFENGAGNIFPAQPASLETAGAVGVNLLRATSDAEPSWQLADDSLPVNFGANVSTTWALLDADTFFMSAERSTASNTQNPKAVLVDPITEGSTPVRADRDYRFSILMAAHRCTGTVEVKCLSDKGTTLTTSTGKVDIAFLGGRFDADYDHVTVNFKTPANTSQVQISVIKGPTTQNEEGFVFFAKPSLVELPVEGTGRLVSKTMLQELKRNPDLQVFSAVLPVPSKLCLNQKDPVTLAVLINGQSQRIPDLAVAWDNPIQIDACWLENRDVLFRGVRPLDDYDDIQVGVFVDGEISVEGTITDLGVFEGRLSLAAKHLDGRPHTIEIRLLPGQFCLSRTFGFVASYITPWDALQEYAKGPFSLTSSPAAVHHYRSYRAWAENSKGRDLSILHKLNDELLQGFKKRTSYPPLSFPHVENPKVSIVIPVHNKFEVTYFCLCSLLFAYNNASFEVIVADDGSSDTTQEMLEFVSGISIVRHETAMGFVDSCNDGASIARGEYLFFLNNDTEVTAGYLDNLLKVFEDFDNVGLAGSKLLYPTGKLQEAGGIVWRTGNPWNVGRNANAAEPQFNYLRQTDYISGAAVMIHRDVWAEVGGFSEELAPAYFEDVDLAMKVRDSGRFVVYVPSSVVFHYEGQSAGTSTASGMKRFQEINRPKFKRKWAKLYSRNSDEGVRPDLEKDRNVFTRVLMMDHAVPNVDADAGSYAAFQTIRILQSLGAKVTFLARNLAWMDRHTIALENIGVECLYAPFVMDVEEYLRAHAADYDIFYLIRFGISQELTPLIRRHAPAAKIILDLCDLHFMREVREAVAGSAEYNFERAHNTRDAELQAIAAVDLTLSYTDVEATVIQSHLLERAKVAKVPWVVEVNPKPRPKFADTKDILFLGGFAHYPNVEAVKFFAQSVLPRLREKLPDVRFKIVGSRAPKDVLALESDSVELLGFVQDLDPLFASARVYVAPLLAGAGMKGKVLEGMAQGIPCVLTPVAAEGTGMASGFDCFIARSVDDWVDSVVKLYTNETLWNKVGNAAKESARTRFSFEVGQDLIRDALGQLEIFAPIKGLHYKHTRP